MSESNEGTAAIVRSGILAFGVPSEAPAAEGHSKARGDAMSDWPDILALTSAVRRGDGEAFSRFYDLYSFRIYKYLLVLARGNEQEAREVCQAVMIKLARRLDLFDDDRRLWAWLCALSKNTFIDHSRANQRRNRLIPLHGQSPEAGSNGSSDDALSEILREILDRLPADERELLQAAYVDERGLQELADECGKTYKAVESRLARLRQKLKEQLLKHLRHENDV